MDDNLSLVGKKLFHALKAIWDHDDFIYGVLDFAYHDDDRLVLLDYIERGKDVTTDSINLLALELQQQRDGEPDE